MREHGELLDVRREDYSKDKKNDVIKFESRLEFYDRCTQRYECTE